MSKLRYISMPKVIVPEVEEIANTMCTLRELAKKLESENDMFVGNLWTTAKFIPGCTEKDGHLYDKDGKMLDNGVGELEYYVWQQSGYCEDDYYGYLYFKTKEPGLFVRVEFEI